MRISGAAIAAIALVACGPAHAQTQDEGGMTDPNQAQAPPSTDYAALKAQYEAETAAYNAAAAAATARAAAIAAQQKAEQARIGTVAGQTAITGSVDVQTGGGKPEAMLLSSRSTALAADAAATSIIATGALGPTGTKLIVLTDMTELSTSELSVFDFQAERLKSLLEAAEASLDVALASTAPARQAGAGGGDRSLLTAAGAVLDLGSKLGSYFQSDYKFSGVEFTDPTNLTAGAVVGAIRARLEPRQDGKADDRVIVSPATLLPSDLAPVLAQLRPADAFYRFVVAKAASAKARADAIRTADAKGAAKLDEAVGVAAKAIAAWEGFLNGLVTATGTDAPPLVRVLRQTKLRAHLASKPRIVLVTTQRAGAYYTKKNLWTFLGGPPLYTAGTTSLVYMVVDSASDSVLASGAVAKHGGYRSVGAVQRLFE